MTACLPASLRVAQVAGKHGDDADDEGSKDGCPEEIVNRELDGGERAYPCSQPQHGCIDDDREKAQSEDRHGQRQKLHDGFDESIDHTKNKTDEQIRQRRVDGVCSTFRACHVIAHNRCGGNVYAGKNPGGQP